MNKSDLIVIGAGPGGYELAAKASDRGLAVTLIERDMLGGTCLNRGCIPTKALCRSAEILSAVRHCDEFGITVDGVTADYAKAVERKDSVVEQLRDGVRSLLSKVNLVSGTARFADASTVMVGDEAYTADTIVVATGSAPALLQVDGVERALTSDDILSMDHLPDSIVIVGGGVIGLEFASILNTYGVAVTVLEYCKEILPGFDTEVAKRLRQLLSRRGIKFVTGAEVTSLADGCVTYIAKGKETVLPAGTVLMAVGRRPVIPEGLDQIVEIGRRGIVTDQDYRSSEPGIFAIGDVNGRCMLAHAATAQGEHVLDVITGHSGRQVGVLIPAAVFTDPEVASVGATEEALVADGIGYAVAKSMYRSNGKAMAMGCTDGFVKLLYDPCTYQIYGCHIIGAHASDLIHEMAVAMNAGAIVTTLKRTVHAHPTLSEILNNAASGAS